MNPGLHSGRDQQEQRNAAKTVTEPPKAATQAEGDPELQEAQVANDTTPAQVTAATEHSANSKTSAHEKAFDLFDVGKLSEKALLIAVGAERSGFELAEVHFWLSWIVDSFSARNSRYILGKFYY